MGVLDFFDKIINNNEDKNKFFLRMHKLIEFYKEDFINESDEPDMENIEIIFSESIDTLYKLDYYELIKEMKKNNLNEDATVLNIIHNTSIFFAEKGKIYTAIEIYDYINTQKAIKKYISPGTYAENRIFIRDISASLRNNSSDSIINYTDEN